MNDYTLSSGKQNIQTRDALNFARIALEGAPQECSFHGQDWGRLGFGVEGPRCDSCKQPWCVWRALDAIKKVP